VRIAVARYDIAAPADFDAFAARQRDWLREAADAGARIAVLPEYLSLELAATFDPEVRADLARSLAAIQPLRARWCALYAGLARALSMHVVAGSFLLDVSEAGARPRYRNRADLFTAGGGHGWQDKLQLTGFEKAVGTIEPGDALKVFTLDGVRVGIAVCYDIEFPLPVRAQREAGARLLLVPSCTDTEAGAHRVRTGCQARALENRCHVAQSVTAGRADWSPALDVNTGDAAVYVPMDTGFPADGVLARGAPGQRWVLADVDPDVFDATRATAQVGIDRDWRGQLAPALARATLERP
jgi:predicted amidohydrolase